MRRPVVAVSLAVAAGLGIAVLANQSSDNNIPGETGHVGADQLAQAPSNGSYTSPRCYIATAGDLAGNSAADWNAIATKVGAPSGAALAAQQFPAATTSTAIKVAQALCFGPDSFVPPTTTTPPTTVAPTTSTSLPPTSTSTTTLPPTTTTLPPTTTTSTTTTSTTTTTVPPTTTTTTTIPATTTTTTIAGGLNYNPANFWTDAAVPGQPYLPPSSPAEGAFRTSCAAAHLNYDDPIVYPNQPGASHLHQYFGNLNVTASSTFASLLANGNSTCDGGPINRTGYWVPALINTAPATDQVVIPEFIITYYKGEPFNGVTKLPVGLRMVAGWNMDTGTVSNGGVEWQCASQGYATSNVIGTCSGDLIAVVKFPHCWDGNNLDSADHRSHMATATNGGWGPCPSSHPIVIPRISYHIHYTVSSSEVLKLSSDIAMGHPGGQTLHGDWFGAWNTTFSDRWFNGCLIGLRSCDPGQPGTAMGDGGRLINPQPGPDSPNSRVPVPPNG